MPTNVTDVIAYTTPVQAIADGDGATGANFLLATQALANRTAYLRDLAVTSGVLAVRTVASIAALQALTGMTNGQTCFVRGFGLFTYVDPDATAISTNWIVAPTSGTGRWFSAQYAMRNVASGIAALDTSAKVPVAQLKNAFISTQSIGMTSDVVMTGVTVTALTLAVAVQTGDIIFVEAPGAAKAASVPGAGDEPTVAVQTTGATVTSAGSAGMTIVRTGSEPTNVNLTLTATSTATLNVNLNIVPQGAGVGATVFRGTTLRATVFRP